MQDIISNLKTRYDTAMQSGSDSAFYQNVHSYIDYIVKTPTLSAILDKSEQEYITKHREIWGNGKCSTDKEADEKVEQTNRLEHFSLFAADYAFLRARIYTHIEEYKNHTEPDERPYPQAIVMLRGVSGIHTNLWSQKTINQCGVWYTNKRKSYEDNLRQFHTNFLIELEKLETDKNGILPEPIKQKIPLSFTDRTGDFVFFDSKGTLSIGTQEFKVFSTLFNSPDYQATYLTLIRSYNPSVEIVQKAYKDDLFVIIRNLKEKFNILPSTTTSNPDIFKNNKKVGYRLVFSPTVGNTE